MSADEPAIDTDQLRHSDGGLLMAHFLTVRDVRRARAFHADLLGGRVVKEENPGIVRLANGWVIMNPGGGSTPDKQDVGLMPYEASGRVSSVMNLRIADIEASYRDWLARGAEMRDPDCYLIEVGQAMGMVEGRLAEHAPAGGEAGRTDGR